MAIFMNKVIPRRKMKFYPGENKDILKSIFLPGFPGNLEVKLFEDAFSRYLGGGECIATCSGRQALKLILESLGLSAGDEIILPAYTLVDLAKMIKEMGFIPIFVDIEPLTMNIDPRLIRVKISKKTKAIVATHLLGAPCQIEEICKIAAENDIAVIEDCAHALGAEINNRKAGTFGKAAFFSFSMSKQINTFGGGLIYSQDKIVIEYGRRTILSSAPKQKEVFISIMTAYLEKLAVLPYFSKLLLSSRKHVEWFIDIYRRAKDKTRSWNKGLSSLQALIGRKQLEGIEQDLQVRAEKVNSLQNLLRENFNFQSILPNTTSAYCYFIVRPKFNYSIENLAQDFIKQGIDVGIKAEIMDHCPRAMGEDPHAYPATLDAETNNTLLPFYGGLSERDINYIAQKANDIARNIIAAFS